MKTMMMEEAARERPLGGPGDSYSIRPGSAQPREGEVEMADWRGSVLTVAFGLAKGSEEGGRVSLKAGVPGRRAPRSARGGCVSGGKAEIRGR